ncbi:hypothetical protein CFOL_v3_21827 [Cephalotus follicularis]|uniref:Uncharacterized protein n=1 Tax=Cephalotus follicularis TaxID=3775 RepID=A0A1Q3CDN4_CEPFO|nr:hypothetical protein CFOL_v3_21827 [Cephalotus follicularis]
MGKRSRDPSMVSTSIALLQERFHKLQREKEKRAERELLMIFSKSPSMCFESNSNQFQFHPEMCQAERPALQESLSLGLNLQNKHAVYRAVTTPALTNFWPNSTATANTSRKFENSDVDTSLHL